MLSPLATRNFGMRALPAPSPAGPRTAGQSSPSRPFGTAGHRGCSIPCRSPDGTGSSLRGRGAGARTRRRVGAAGRAAPGGCESGAPAGRASLTWENLSVRPGQELQEKEDRGDAGHPSPEFTCPPRCRGAAASPPVSPALVGARRRPRPRSRGAARRSRRRGGGSCPRAQRRPRWPGPGTPGPLPAPGARLAPRAAGTAARALGSLVKPGCAHAQRPAVAAGAQHRAALPGLLLLPSLQRGWRGSAGAGVKRWAGIGGGIGAGMGWDGGSDPLLEPRRRQGLQPCRLMDRLLRAAHGHLQLKPMISIIIHFTFGSSVLNTESHRTWALLSLRQGDNSGHNSKHCCPHVTS